MNFFDKHSVAGTGWLVLILGMIARFFDVDVDQTQLTELALAILTFVGAIMAFWGQVRRSDLYLGIFRK